MQVNIQQKVILVTGASRGLGAKLAYRLSQEGAYVIINYNKSKLHALELYEEIVKINNNSMMIHADVRDEMQVKNMFEVIFEKYGKIDVLINNAGILDDHPILKMDLDSWDHVIYTNLTGTFLCTKFAADYMKEARDGKIINIASVKGQIGFSNQVNYCSSKSALIGLTKSLAKELSVYNISINAVCPGFITTDLNKSDHLKRNVAIESSLLSIENNLYDYLNFITFFCSDSFKGSTGQIYNLDSRIP